MAFRLGILAAKDSPSARELQRAAAGLRIETQLLGFPDLTTSLIPAALCENPSTPVPALNVFARTDANSSNRSNCWPAIRPSHQNSIRVVDQSNGLYRDQAADQTGDSYHAIIVRSMPLGSLEQVIFRMDALQGWQSLGIPVINQPRCLETAIDKWLTLHRLHEEGITAPPTVVCQTRQQAIEAFELLGNDVLVKPLFGGEGRGIIHLQDLDLAWRTFSTLQQLGQVLYLQQFIPNFGYDIRVLVVGEQLFSIRRRAATGQYRTNISQGGVAEACELTDSQRELAVRCAAAVAGEIVGVDLLPAQDGQCYALEVNAVPGWRAVAACLNVDVAQLIIQYALQRIGKPIVERKQSSS